MTKHSTLALLTRTLTTVGMAMVVVSAQMPPRQPAIPPRPVQPASPQTTTPPAQTGQVFRAGTEIISIDVYPRDAKGAFVPGLTAADFQLFEDGVEQKIENFVFSNGGQFYSTFASARPTRTEGLILPQSKPPADNAGRIFIIFIDDLHFQASQTPIVRDLLKLIRDTLVHENDLVGFVSSGHSSIALDPAYDFQHKRFNEVINRVVGSGPSTEEMVRMQTGNDGLSELNHNIGVAFQAANNLLKQLEDVRHKRKSFIWVSNGYSLDPFKDSRMRTEFERYVRTGACPPPEEDPAPFTEDPRPRNDPCRYVDADMAQMQNIRIAEAQSGFDMLGRNTLQWKTADLMSEMTALIRNATRANTMLHTLDPRGLISGLNSASMQQQLSNQEETEFIMQTVGTLQSLAENTGGVACVKTNDCRPALQQIDNMTSDYYMLGYRSTNPDPFKLVRKIEIKVARPEVSLEPGKDYRETYFLKRPNRR